MSQNTLKILLNGETRRIHVDASSFSIAELRRVIKTLFKHDLHYVIRYEDDEHDMITMTCDDELREAFLLADQSMEGTLKIELRPSDNHHEQLRTPPVSPKGIQEQEQEQKQEQEQEQMTLPKRQIAEPNYNDTIGGGYVSSPFEQKLTQEFEPEIVHAEIEDESAVEVKIESADFFIGKKVFLRGAHGLNLQANPSHQLHTHANKSDWETWTIEDAGEGRVFVCGAHGKLQT